MESKDAASWGNRDLATEVRHGEERVEVWVAVASPERLGVVVEVWVHLGRQDGEGGCEVEAARKSSRRVVEIGREGLAQGRSTGRLIGFGKVQVSLTLRVLLRTLVGRHLGVCLFGQS